MTSSITLITGGSRGIGRSAALSVARKGSDVILTYRTGEAEAHAVAEEVRALGRTAIAVPLDVTDAASFPAFARTIREHLARTWKREQLDFFVSNAGTSSSAPFTETTPAQLAEQLAVHTSANYLLTQALVPLIADGGRIVSISTGLTRYSYAGASAYAVAKAGHEVLARYLAIELGPRGITANVVAPGGVVTDIGGGLMRNAAVQDAVTKSTALGRVGQPDDIGDVVALLVSPEARWITGQRIEVTGGYML